MSTSSAPAVRGSIAAQLDALAGQTLDLAHRVGLHDAPAPAEHHLRSSWAGTPLTITPHTRCGAQMPLLRVVRVDGGSRVQVLNIVAFPSIQSALPIVGCEILAFARGLHLLVLDAFPLGADLEAGAATLRALRDARARIPERLLQRELPSWGRGVFSPETVLIKPDARDDLAGQIGVEDACEMAADIFKSFLENDFLGASSKVYLKGVDKARLDARKHYLHTHATEEPAGPFLTRIAGEAWVHRFVTQLLYPQWLHDQDNAPPWRVSPHSPQEVSR